jgi:formate dehydrogenase (NADP+) beta subunit
MPLGYEVVIFEKYDKPGGLMRTNIPSFRLPEARARRETTPFSTWASKFATTRRREHEGAAGRGTSTRSSSAAARRAAKNLEIPGRHDTDRIHIGIDWLESVAFGHTDSIGERC